VRPANAGPGVILDDEHARMLATLAANPSFRWSHEERMALEAGMRALEALARQRRSDEPTGKIGPKKCAVCGSTEHDGPGHR